MRKPELLQTKLGSGFGFASPQTCYLVSELWSGSENRMMLCRLESNLGMPRCPQGPAALTAGCTLGRGPHCLDIAHSPLGLLDQSCCDLRTKGLPLTQQAVDGAHRAPRQTTCLLSVNSASHFIFKIKRETSKVSKLLARLGTRKACSRALQERGCWEGENAG